MSESGTIAVYERWYQEGEDVFVEYYTFVNGKKRDLGRVWTPYKNCPIVLMGEGHLLADRS